MTAEERLRAVAERIRERAREMAPGAPLESDPAPTPSVTADRLADATPGPPPHWQEAAEERALELRQPPLQVEAGEVAARETACARLRRLLADGAWHSALELVEAGGLRYGGRLHELRRGLDGGPPLEVEAQQRAGGGRARWWYRAPAKGA